MPCLLVHSSHYYNQNYIIVPFKMLILFLASASPGKLQQSRDVNMALVLISTVAMFVLCHTPRWENKFREKV